MPEAEKEAPNWNFIGRGYDLVFLNPYSLSNPESNPPPSSVSQRTGTKSRNVFHLEATKEAEGVSEWSIPPETSCSGIYHTSIKAETETISASSDILISTKTSVEVSGSDPTGELFSCSAGHTVSVMNQEIHRNNRTLTESHASRETYRLTLENLDGSSQEYSLPTLDKDFRNMVLGANKDNINHFINTYGTHFAQAVTFGGKGYQQFHLEASEHEHMLNLGVDIKRNASATLDVLKVGGSLDSSNKVDTAFKDAIKKQLTEVNLIGGDRSDSEKNWDAWVNSVDDKPVPIKVVLFPHYTLINKVFFKDTDEETLDKQRDFINSQCLQYIKSKGENLSRTQLKYGTKVYLQLVWNLEGLLNPKNTKYLSHSNNEISMIAQRDTAIQVQLPSNFVWKLVCCEDSNADGLVNLDNEIAFKNLSNGSYLDSEAARENFGHVGLNSDITDKSKWDVKRVFSTQRGSNEPLTSGDIISLHRKYNSPNPSDPQGYLQSRDNKLYSNGKIPKTCGDNPIGNGCYFRVLLAEGEN